MTSIPPSRIGDQQRYDPDVRKAAEKYVQDYHKHAVQYLIDNCDPVQLLKDACTFEHHNYFQVMAQESEFDDDTVSRSSRRRTYSSNSRSAITSASSVNISSSESGDSSPDILWVVAEASPKRRITVRATTLPQSDNLIQVDVVRDRLVLEPKRLPSGTEVSYNGGPMHSLGTVSLEWAGRCKDLGSRKAQRGTFHVVEEIPDKDVVLGDSDSADSPTSHKDTFSFNHDPRPGVYGEFQGRERPPPLNTHIVFQEAPRTHSNTANSTALTAKQTVIDRPSQGHADRRKSAASEISKIPRMSSGSSVGSISTNQSRVPIRQRQNEGPLHRPPPSDPGLTSGFSVTVIYGKSIMSFKLELNAPGATFYESLKRTIRQRTRRDLDRDLDLVCFTPSKDAFSNCCYVSLAEDQVADDWENAVEWINDIKSEGQRKIFAIIGPEDDTPPG